MLLFASRLERDGWVWRSLVACLNGVQEAGGSNPLTQTTICLRTLMFSGIFHVLASKKPPKRFRGAVFIMRIPPHATWLGNSLHLSQLIAICTRNLCSRTIRMPGTTPLAGVVRLIARRILQPVQASAVSAATFSFPLHRKDSMPSYPWTVPKGCSAVSFLICWRALSRLVVILTVSLADPFR